MNEPVHFFSRLTSTSSTGRSRLNWLSTFLLLLILLPVAGVAAQTGSAPSAPPDAEVGLAIHSERCANCHGERGLGDGELAADLANPPAPHASPEYLRTAVPAEMYNVVTNGRVANSMPPFGPSSSDPLSDDERWDLVAALYALGTPQESVSLGRQTYEDNCLSCHGPAGQGDGPDAAALETDVGDLSELAYWSSTSNQDVYSRLAEAGGIEVHDFELEEDELWATVDYLRTFSYQYVDALARFRPLETATISGQVLNGTTNEPLAAGSSVTLFGFLEDVEPQITMTTTVDVDGGYQFVLEDVPQDWIYRVSTEYQGIDFSSTFGELNFEMTSIDLPVVVYEPTTEATDISIQQLHVFLNFGNGFMEVSELYVVGNTGQEVFVGEDGPGGGTIVLDLPPGAQSVTVQRGFQGVELFLPLETVPSGDQQAVSIPVRPGSASLTLLVEYGIPYEEEAALSHVLNYPTTGVNLLVPDVGVSLDENDGWRDMGQQSTEMGVFTTYNLDGISSGETLNIRLEGRARSTASAAIARDPGTEMLAGAAALLAVGAVGVVVVRRWRHEPDLEAERLELLQALAELDDEYAAGLVMDDEYQLEREALKADLLAIWEE